MLRLNLTVLTMPIAAAIGLDAFVLSKEAPSNSSLAHVTIDTAQPLTPRTPAAPKYPNDIKGLSLPTLDLEAQNGEILVNQHGFISNGPKRAVVRFDSPSGVMWRLRDNNDVIVMMGRSENFGADALSGHSVHHIDFSSFGTQGEGYRLQVGTTYSQPFSISDRPYEQLSKDSLSYFYLNRSAEPIIAAHAPAATPPLTRAAGHVSETVTCYNGEDFNGINWPSCGYANDVSGGWYDAGDYGKYTVSNGLTVWSMLNIAERRKQDSAKCAIVYQDGDMPIPENQNGINDLLDEAKRGIDQMLKMQITETTPVAVALGEQPDTASLNLTQINAAGMVHHKVHSETWLPDLIRPADDNITRYLYPPSTTATLHLAAVGAQCARHYEYVDPKFAQRCLEAAKTAYSAAKATPDAYAYDNFDGGGGYADGWAGDEFAWAATELFLTTQDQTYFNDIQTYQGDYYNTSGQSDMFWGDMQNFGMLALARASLKRQDQNFNRAEVNARRDVLSLADEYVSQTANTGYIIPRDVQELYWGSNSAMLYRAMILAHAYEISADDKYYQGVVNVMDYLLGRNPLGQSYISGYGEKAMERPHHRFWANIRDASFPKPPPGALSGGPNNTAMVDPIAQELEGNCIGLTCWADHEDAYSLNEVSIIWNAALLWVSNWLDSQSAQCLHEPLDPRWGPY